MHWVDKYPHKIWTSILTLDNKVIDYRIGNRERDKYTWTIMWNKEIRERFDELQTISSYEEVDNSIEHNKAFENGRQLVDNHKEKHGVYSYD